jgi:hypothetical protein
MMEDSYYSDGKETKIHAGYIKPICDNNINTDITLLKNAVSNKEVEKHFKHLTVEHFYAEKKKKLMVNRALVFVSSVISGGLAYFFIKKNKKVGGSVFSLFSGYLLGKFVS